MANAEHYWKDCPFDMATDAARDVDVSKSNHFFHDTNGGCPAVCRLDHNHPGIIVPRGGEHD